MSAPDPLTPPQNKSAPLRTGETPAGLYWSLPLLTAAVCVGACLCVWLLHTGRVSGEFRVLAATTIASLCILLAAAIFQALRQSRWEAETLRRRLETLELLTAVAAAIGTEEQGESIVLQRLTQALRAMLGMKKSYVGILEEEGTILQIVSSSGIDPPLDGQRRRLDELPVTARCLHMRQVVTVLDTRHSPIPINTAFAQEMGVRSMLQIPMIFQDRPMGVLVLGDDRARTFTEMDLRRAELWGSQATLTVANSRLYASMSQSLRQQKRLMEHRNALYALNTAIQRPGELEEILQRIAELAPGPLECDGTLIWLVADDNPNDLIVAVATMPYGASVTGFRLPIRGSLGESVLSRRQRRIVENIPKEPGANPRLSTLLPRGSLVMEPLLCADGEPLGILVLLRDRSGPFDRDQLELAALFSQRASAVIETARRTRRDAETRTILLRELNHRVKNNLASIVSLLSINQPNLPPDAAQWLKRAVDRISAMSEVHDLLSGGSNRVTLAELMDRTIRSLSVAKPPGVDIRTELAAGADWLRTDRAVSLAMAMHEICVNGIVHGLGQAGVLIIRAHRHNGELSVSIEDDSPRDFPDAQSTDRPPAIAKPGIGLTLVRGLVSRELRGRFTLSPASRGTLATVQFPLLPDELPEEKV